jgi:hypothetical protein
MYRLPSIIVAIGIFVITLFSTVDAHATVPQSLNCPRNQPIALTGSGTPGEALLVYFAARPVGGGVVSAGGDWTIPLTVNERAGRYPVEVRARSSQRVVAAWMCQVADPRTTATSPAATVVRTAVPTQVTTSTSIPTTTAPAVAPTSPPTSTPLRPTNTEIPASEQPRVTPTSTASVAQDGPAPTTIPESTAPVPREAATDVALEITAIEVGSVTGVPHYGFITLRTTTGQALELQGIVLVNQTRPVAPRLDLEGLRVAEQATLTIMLQNADTRNETTPTVAYWRIGQQVWQTGDRVSLQTIDGRELTTIEVR